MLLKFTTPDMLNTTLLDVARGDRAYEITTVVEPVELAPIPAFTTSSEDESSSSKSASSSRAKKPRSYSQWEDKANVERRKTTITDASGCMVATILWKGRRPEIVIRDEKVGALTDLFGSSSVRFLPKIMAIPTRFDTEYVWTASADGLTLFDYDSETVKGTFHQNVIRLPTKAFKTSSVKAKLTSPSRPLLDSAASLSSSSLSESDSESKPTKGTFLPSLPGLGSNFLEFESNPLADDVEIIISFIMMEILRRGRFNLTPYTFEQPKLWQFKETRDLFLRRLRRNTV